MGEDYTINKPTCMRVKDTVVPCRQQQWLGGWGLSRSAFREGVSDISAETERSLSTEPINGRKGSRWEDLLETIFWGRHGIARGAQALRGCRKASFQIKDLLEEVGFAPGWS